MLASSLTILAVVYGAGVARLWRHAGYGRGIRRFDVLAFSIGWFAIAVALDAAQAEFEIEVLTSPPHGADMSAFKPQFEKYRVILSNYNGDPWPPGVKTAFETYMRNGGGLVSFHAADNSFPEWPAYNRLGGHFAGHYRVRHSSREYVVGDAYTNTVEGFFGNLKTGIRGNYKKVSHRWLQGYLNEFTWRYNHRHDRRAMFHLLVSRAVEG